MFEGLKKLNLAIKAEEKRLMKRGKDFGLPLLVNKRFRERKKPGPKVNWEKRKKKVEALVLKLNCHERIGIVSSDLIENWFSPSYTLGYSMHRLGYSMDDSGENDIPVPHWYISRGSLNYPQIIIVNFYLETEFEKGRPVRPHLKIEINFTPKITLCRLFRTITIDKVCEQIIDMFYEVYGEFAKKKGIQIN